MKKAIDIILSKEPYSKNLILESLSTLEIKKHGHQVQTYLKGNLISRSNHSEKYSIFNFGDFIRSNITKIEEKLSPLFFDLKICKGVQELKFYGNEFLDKDQLFHKMITVFSSSNGYYPLLINAGLMRQICTNGAMAMVGVNPFLTRTKHYSIALDTTIKNFENKLQTLEMTFIKQLGFFEYVTSKEILFSTLVKKIVMKKEDKVQLKSKLETVIKLGELLQTGIDKIDISRLDEFQINSLKSPILLISNNSNCADLEVNMANVYNCYTQMFRFRHFVTMERENRRIQDILLED